MPPSSHQGTHRWVPVVALATFWFAIGTARMLSDGFSVASALFTGAAIVTGVFIAIWIGNRWLGSAGRGLLVGGVVALLGAAAYLTLTSGDRDCNSVSMIDTGVFPHRSSSADEAFDHFLRFVPDIPDRDPTNYRRQSDGTRTRYTAGSLTVTVVLDGGEWIVSELTTC